MGPSLWRKHEHSDSVHQNGYTYRYMRQNTFWKRCFNWLGLAASVSLPLIVSGVAAAQAVSQGYGITGSVQNGMIVMLDPNNSKKVTPLSNTSDKSMLGVVVAANDSVVSLGGDTTATQVFVASSGKYDALVSNQNGAIKTGDIISISALDGVGMKANGDQSVVLGKALSSFDGVNSVSGTATLKTTGGTKNVSIGYIQIDISISHNPLASSTSGALPSFLSRAGQNIAGRPVSAVRLYVSIGVLVLTLFMASSLLYGGVHSSLVSLGRNPLAKKSILRGLVQVVVMGLIVFVIGLVAIYLLLKL